MYAAARSPIQESSWRAPPWPASPSAACCAPRPPKEQARRTAKTSRAMPTTYEETETHARAAERHPPVSTTIVDLGADLLDMLATIGRLFVKESRDNVGKAVEHAIHAMFALGLCLIGAGLLLVAVQALLAAALANVVSR